MASRRRGRLLISITPQAEPSASAPIPGTANRLRASPTNGVRTAGGFALGWSASSALAGTDELGVVEGLVSTTSVLEGATTNVVGGGCATEEGLRVFVRGTDT